MNFVILQHAAFSVSMLIYQVRERVLGITFGPGLGHKEHLCAQGNKWLWEQLATVCLIHSYFLFLFPNPLGSLRLSVVNRINRIMIVLIGDYVLILYICNPTVSQLIKVNIFRNVGHPNFLITLSSRMTRTTLSLCSQE